MAAIGRKGRGARRDRASNHPATRGRAAGRRTAGTALRAVIAGALALGLCGTSPAAPEASIIRASYAPPRAIGRLPDARGFSLSDGYVSHLVDLINDYRTRHNLPRLAIAADLDGLAEQHSLVMAERHRISHDGFVQRFESANSDLCVENVGVHFAQPEALLDGWRASPEHLRNLLEPRIRRVGIANVDSFVTFFACV